MMADSASYAVPVASNPPGATVVYQGADVGVTPCTISMRKRCTEIALHLDGYHPHKVDVGFGSAANGGWFLLGFLLFGPFELIVDVVADGFTGVNESPVRIDLVPSANPPPSTWKRN